MNPDNNNDIQKWKRNSYRIDSISKGARSIGDLLNRLSYTNMQTHLE